VLLGKFWLGVNFGNGTISVNEPIGSNKTLPDDLSYDEVERLYDVLKENYDGKLTVDELTDGLKAGLVKAAGDPYTEYFDAEAAKNFDDQLEGTFSGIGAELGKNKDDNLIIVAPISGFPADKAGLRPQDIIVAVNGESASDMSIDEAVSKIRGKKGTQVKLDVLRGSERKEFTITREDIKVPSVKHEILPNNIGYIEITQFWTDTASLTRQALTEFKQAGVKGVIVDLRGNPGGALDASVDIASLWLPEGKVVLQEKRDGQIIQTYNATGSPVLAGVPTIVLIDEGSASASEILAGALKDNGAATLLGAKSYGKGSVQQIINLRDGGEIKITVARWYRPNGQNIDKKGIEPDTKVQMTEEDYAADRDPQKDKAIEQLLKR
jgi:carboxyl-terminal processing protease